MEERENCVYMVRIEKRTQFRVENLKVENMRIITFSVFSRTMKIRAFVLNSSHNM